MRDLIILILVIVILAGLVYFFFYKYRQKTYFLGYFEYYDEETSKPVKKIFDLARHKKKIITISAQMPCDIHLRTAYSVGTLRLFSSVSENKREIPLSDELQKLLKFSQQAKPGFVTHGDCFRIGTYVFHYHIR